jgi:multidrug efflux pump subunit AcrB
MAAIPDARVNFQSQNGGGPDADGRDIMLYLGGDDPEQIEAVANKIAKDEWRPCTNCARRASGRAGPPEITIKPRFDLAADLGVTTAALSQTIRIATLGDIEQNSAKFSLSDRQVPITVSLSENARRDLSTLENLAGADVQRRFGAAEVGRGDRLRLGPDDGPAHQPDPPHRGRRRPRSGLVSGRRLGPRSTSCRR